MKKYVKYLCFAFSIFFIFSMLVLYTYGLKSKNSSQYITSSSNDTIKKLSQTNNSKSELLMPVLSGKSSSGPAASSETNTEGQDTDNVKSGSINSKLKINCGPYNTMILDDSGNLKVYGLFNIFAAGNNKYSTVYNKTVIKDLKNIKYVTSGTGFIAALKNDSSVWIYGGFDDSIENMSSQPGVDANMFKQLGDLKGIIQIAAGANHLLALDAGGSVWSWGYNSSGQLGDGTTENSLTPVKLLSLSDIVYISAGLDFSAAVKNDGTVWAWGSNNFNQLGDGNPGGVMYLFDEGFDKNKPVQVKGLQDITSISCGWQHGLALDKNGSVFAWGNDMSGQLGDGSAVVYQSPFRIESLSDISAIAAGQGHSLALKKDGTVWEWGDEFAYLDDALSLEKSKPHIVTGLHNIESIFTGYGHSVVIGSDGAVWSWGINEYGQLCNEGEKPERKPQMLEHLKTFSVNSSEK